MIGINLGHWEGSKKAIHCATDHKFYICTHVWRNSLWQRKIEVFGKDFFGFRSIIYCLYSETYPIKKLFICLERNKNMIFLPIHQKLSEILSSAVNFFSGNEKLPPFWEILRLIESLLRFAAMCCAVTWCDVL